MQWTKNLDAFFFLLPVALNVPFFQQSDKRKKGRGRASGRGRAQIKARNLISAGELDELECSS